MTLFRGSGEVGTGEQTDYLRSNNNLSDVNDVPEARQNLGLDSLSSIAGLTPTDSTFIVGDGVNWVNESGATARSSLGLTIGADVQSHDSGLDDISALTPVDSNFIVGDGTNWVRESGTTVRSSLGLGNAATTDILDEDDMVSDSATEAPSQQSVVRYNEDLYNCYVVGTNQYPTIQSAIDAVAAGTGLITGLSVGEIYIPAKDDTVYTETVSLAAGIGKGGMRIRGQGINTYIRGSGAHAFEITQQDCQLSGLWIDQIDASGNFDGIHSTAPELRIDYVDVDAAPRNGIYLNGGRPEVSNVHIKGGDVIGFEVDTTADRFRASNLTFQSCPAIGLYLRGDLFNVQTVVNQPGGTGVRIDGNWGYITAVVNEAGGQGIQIDGDHNIVHIVARNCDGDGVRIGGNDNTVYVSTDGNGVVSGDDVAINSGATNNVIFGRIVGTIQDNGTGTVLYT